MGLGSSLWKLTATLGLCARIHTTSAAPDGDKVTKLPGWEGSLPSEMYSGYVDVGEDKSHYIHYVFIESEQDPTTDPVILWVQGGPGGSSMEGWLTENMGPLQVADISLVTSPPSLLPSRAPWTQFANMLFWEAPSGVGFSYCDDVCPWWNDTISAVENAEFICNWFELFPEYIDNPFYIMGESYAGVYIPTTTIELLKTKCNGVNDAFKGDLTINYKGVGIGNGCTGIDAGPCNQQRSVNTFNQLYQQGFVSLDTFNLVNLACADSNGYVNADQDCQDALLTASDEIGPFTNWNVHDVCGPPSLDATFANFLCGATVINGATSPTEWACSDSIQEADGKQAMTPQKAFDLFFTQHNGKRKAPQNEQEKRSGKSWVKFQQDLLSLILKESQQTEEEMEVDSNTAVTGVHKFEETSLLLSNLLGETFTCNAQDAMATYLSDPDVMEALHVKVANKTSWPGDGIQYNRSATNLLISPGYPDLIQAGRVLIFSGDFDGQIPHSGSEIWTSGMGYPVKSSFQPWYVNGYVAGHTISYETSQLKMNSQSPLSSLDQTHKESDELVTEFTFLTIAGAGHMAPHYKPVEAREMLKRFLAGDGYVQ